MHEKFARRVALINILLVLVQYSSLSTEDDGNVTVSRSSNKVLSRKKRYLVFPEGSSLQLVYCLTVGTYAPVSFFTVGVTAALAWELPHDPIAPFKEHVEGIHRQDKPGTYLIGPVKKKPPNPKLTFNKWSYDVYRNRTALFSANRRGGTKKNKRPLIGSRRPTVNTYSSVWNAFNNYRNVMTTFNKNKVSPYSQTARPVYGTNKKYSHARPQSKKTVLRPVYKSQRHRIYNRPIHKHPVYKEIHRRSRRELFLKIEKFFHAQKEDGKTCLLKALCEVNQSPSKQKGNFVEEIIRAIFTWHKDENLGDEYDKAAATKEDCYETYPCTLSVFNLFF